MNYEVSNFARYELKMECDGRLLEAIRGWVRLNSAGFHPIHHARQVNSFYFDTRDLDMFNLHVSSAAERRKFRYRWYGKHYQPQSGQFEFKNKRERAGWKDIQPVDLALDFERSDWREVQTALLDYLAAQQAHEFYEALKATTPVVLNQYDREYYESADGAIRLTIDSRIAAFDQTRSPRPNLRFALPALDQVIIELKCDVQYARSAANVLAQFPVRATRHSKYISAMDGILER